MRVSVVVLLVSVNLYAAFACTIEQEMALLSALKGMKECRRCALMNLWKPLECKGPEFLPPKWKWSKGYEWDKPKCDWAKGKGYETALSPLVYLLPSPAPLPPPLPLQQLQPHYLPSAPPPPCACAAPPPPPPTWVAPPQTCPLPPPPPPSCPAPAPQQFFYVPQPQPTCPCPKQSPLLYLSKKGW